MKGGRLQGFNNLTESEGETKIFALVCFTKDFVKLSSFFPKKIIAKSVKNLVSPKGLQKTEFKRLCEGLKKATGL